MSKSSPEIDFADVYVSASFSEVAYYRNKKSKNQQNKTEAQIFFEENYDKDIFPKILRDKDEKEDQWKFIKHLEWNGDILQLTKPDENQKQLLDRVRELKDIESKHEERNRGLLQRLSNNFEKISKVSESSVQLSESALKISESTIKFSNSISESWHRANNSNKWLHYCIFKNEKRKKVIIAFKGTDDLASVTKAIDVGRGINISVPDDILKEFEAFIKEQSGFEIILTGHSLGGYIAAKLYHQNETFRQRISHVFCI